LVVFISIFSFFEKFKLKLILFLFSLVLLIPELIEEFEQTLFFLEKAKALFFA